MHARMHACMYVYICISFMSLLDTPTYLPPTYLPTYLHRYKHSVPDIHMLLSARLPIHEHKRHMGMHSGCIDASTEIKRAKVWRTAPTWALCWLKPAVFSQLALILSRS